MIDLPSVSDIIDAHYVVIVESEVRLSLRQQPGPTGRMLFFPNNSLTFTPLLFKHRPASERSTTPVRRPSTAAVAVTAKKGTSGTVQFYTARAGAACANLQAKTLRSAAFSDEFREPGTRNDCPRKHHARHSFIRAAANAKTHSEISEMCHWHLPLGDIFTSICLAP
jgi:hypothetical protein